MTSGAGMAARATPPDLIDGGRAAPAPRPAAPVTSERYLAPALQAAAAARARSARIRAATLAATAPRAAERDPAGHAAPEGRSGWWVSAKPATAPDRPPAAGRRFGGLSVAAAARAATIAFQPVRRLVPPVAAGGARQPARPPAARPAPAAAAVPAASQADARALAPPPPERPPAAHPAPPRSEQPPAAHPAATADCNEEAQRFTRTVAELERYVAASRTPEPDSRLVPHQPLPLVDQEPPGPAWLRLWSRR